MLDALKFAINGKQIELTKQEAMDLSAELVQLFGQPAAPYTHWYPYQYPWPTLPTFERYWVTRHG